MRKFDSDAKYNNFRYTHVARDAIMTLNNDKGIKELHG